ncbi:flagellar hook-length control protein FliK [Helicobacter suis]
MLRQELLDFKPPITKLSIELNPDNLGKVEVVIQQVGKNIQVSVASSPPVSAL